MIQKPTLEKRTARGLIVPMPQGKPKGGPLPRKRAGRTRNTGTTPSRRWTHKAIREAMGTSKKYIPKPSKYWKD